MNQLIESEAPTNLTKISEQAREVRWQLLEAVSQDADALAHCSAASLREISRHLGWQARPLRQHVSLLGRVSKSPMERNFSAGANTSLVIAASTGITTEASG